MNKNEFLAFSLPYGLHILNGKESDVVVGMVGDSVLSIFRGNLDNTWDITDVRPIFHPLPDLTKPIEHKGEKFVPMIELAKMEGLIPSERIAITADGDIRLRLMLNPENKRPLTPVDFILDITECVFKIQSTTWHSMQVKTQREMQKNLLEWHFDIADLISKGEAIDVNTLPENPYK